MCVNELAHGDLDMLLLDEEILEDDELMLNLLFQTFISIGTFHNITGYVHKDCHNGNFCIKRIMTKDIMNILLMVKVII
jgi:hypothetical protein